VLLIPQRFLTVRCRSSGSRFIATRQSEVRLRESAAFRRAGLGVFGHCAAHSINYKRFLVVRKGQGGEEFLEVLVGRDFHRSCPSLDELGTLATIQWGTPTASVKIFPRPSYGSFAFTRNPPLNYLLRAKCI
jgi:hypothetical protein